METDLHEFRVAAPPTDILSTKETEPGEHTILLYGQHRIKERVAYEVARRIVKFSLMNKNGNMLAIEYPEGADYNDAYEQAKKETLGENPPYKGIREAYHKSIKEKTDEVLKVRDNACQLYPDRVIVDVHETTSFAQEEIEARRNEMIFLTGLTVKQNEELNKELANIFPGADDVNGYLSRLVLLAKNPNPENTERQLPVNLVVVEMTTRGDDIYDHVANNERVYDVGRDEREDYLHRAKDTPHALQGINREATIYTRLLEKVIPVVERYYQDKVLSQIIVNKEVWPTHRK